MKVEVSPVTPGDFPRCSGCGAERFMVHVTRTPNEIFPDTDSLAFHALESWTLVCLAESCPVAKIESRFVGGWTKSGLPGRMNKV
jgi:hypothetical protein